MLPRFLINIRLLLRCAFLIPILVGQVTLVEAKFSSGIVNIGGSKDENKFVYVSKMAYVPGDGSYSIRIKPLRPGVLPGFEGGSGAESVRLNFAIFLDEEWENYNLDTMKPVCDRIKHSRSTRSILLKTNSGMGLSEWSIWEKGGLKQVVRPHIWYFVLHNCDNVLPERIRLKYEFEALQYDGSHYSSELEGLSTVYLLKLLLFGGYLLHYINLCKGYLHEINDSTSLCHTAQMGGKKSSLKIFSFWGLNWGNLHPVIWCLSCVIAFQVLSTACEYSHLLVYSSNGIGVKGLTVMSDILAAISQVIIQSILILIALGWLVLQSNLGDLDIVIPVIFILIIVNSMLTVIGHIQDDTSFKYFSQEGWLGYTMCLLRIAMWGWFSWGVGETRKTAPSKMSVFFSKFWVAGTMYFLSYPIIFVITSLFAPYLRHKFLVTGVFASFAFSVRWLEGLFLKKGEFFRVSTLGSDGCLPGAGGFNIVKGE